MGLSGLRRRQRLGLAFVLTAGVFPAARYNKNISPHMLFMRAEMFLFFGGNAVEFCKRYSRVAWSQTGHKEGLFTRLRCKQWSCDYCAAKNASIWRAHLNAKLPMVSDEWYLLTLTAHENTRSTAQSLENIRSSIDTLFKRAKRVFGGLSYVRVYERHPTSRAIHAHFIVAGVTPFVAVGSSAKLRPMALAVLERNNRNGVWAVKTWFKINARECGMGYIVDIRKIVGEPKKAVMYVTKYLTKSQQDLHIKGLRHVQTTTDIGGPKTEGEYEWHTGTFITPYSFEPNTQVQDLNTGKVINNDYWEQHGVYPWDD